MWALTTYINILLYHIDRSSASSKKYSIKLALSCSRPVWCGPVRKRKNAKNKQDNRGSHKDNTGQSNETKRANKVLYNFVLVKVSERDVKLQEPRGYHFDNKFP